MQITKDTIIGDIVRMGDEGLQQILLQAGMHCLGCPASQAESIEQAAMVHGIDADALVQALNAYLA